MTPSPRTVRAPLLGDLPFLLVKGVAVQPDGTGRYQPKVYCTNCRTIIPDIRQAGVVFPKHGPAQVLCRLNGCLRQRWIAALPWQELTDFFGRALTGLALPESVATDLIDAAYQPPREHAA